MKAYGADAWKQLLSMILDDLRSNGLDGATAEAGLLTKLVGEEKCLEFWDLGAYIAVLILPFIARSQSCANTNSDGGEHVFAIGIVRLSCDAWLVRAVVVWDWRSVTMLASLDLGLFLVLRGASEVLLWDDLRGSAQGSLQVARVEGIFTGVKHDRVRVAKATVGHCDVCKKDVSVNSMSEGWKWSVDSEARE